MLTIPASAARDKINYDSVLADSEREAVADLLNYLENRAETDFFSGMGSVDMKGRII